VPGWAPGPTALSGVEAEDGVGSPNEGKGISWIGVGTDSIARMRSFAIDVLGMRLAGQDREDFVVLALDDGAKLELFGPGSAEASPRLFEANPVAAGFLVDDIKPAGDELARTPDVELLGELQVRADGYARQHFRAPDGYVYELTADPAAG
jgi:catechol 2,3-dioxygenase-like lactoylglutathione lyase family enzyme